MTNYFSYGSLLLKLITAIIVTYILSMKMLVSSTIYM